MLSRLNAKAGDKVLDVGCGTGAQSLPLLKLVGETGVVCSLDISAESVTTLIEKAQGASNLTAVVSDMAELETVIADRFLIKSFDLAISCYALYYSPERMRVLDIMRQSLSPHGQLVVFTPNKPHGMVDAVRRIGPIPEEIDDSLGFGPAVLEPHFRKQFWDVTVHFFHNIMRVSDVEDAVNFFRSTTYYDKALEEPFRNEVKKEMAAKGVFEYEKNGYLICGRRPFEAA